MEIFATCQKKDGYYGAVANVKFALLNGDVIAIAEKCGYFRTGLKASHHIEAIDKIKSDPMFFKIKP